MYSLLQVLSGSFISCLAILCGDLIYSFEAYPMQPDDLQLAGNARLAALSSVEINILKRHIFWFCSYGRSYGGREIRDSIKAGKDCKTTAEEILQNIRLFVSSWSGVRKNKFNRDLAVDLSRDLKEFCNPRFS